MKDDKRIQALLPTNIFLRIVNRCAEMSQQQGRKVSMSDYVRTLINYDLNVKPISLLHEEPTK